MANKVGSGDRKDFDETRRLLYMALLVNRTKRYNLAGTLVNALKHHHAVDDMDVDEIITHIIGVIEGEGSAASVTWVEEQIARITEELGD